MSITVAAVVKKAAVCLAADKRTWKAIGFIAALLITIALLPVMVLLAIGNQFSSVSGVSKPDYSQFVQSLSQEQLVHISQIQLDGKSISDTLSKSGLKTQTVKAQIIYLTYFENVQKNENFFLEYCSFFKENDNKNLIDSLNKKYGLSIDYNEFMRSYAVLSNVSIDNNLFVNPDVKNNIDLVRWAENACETQWGYVPYTDGNVLSSEKYKALKEKYPDEIKEDCDKWQSRRTVDNFTFLKSYLWYDAESRTILAEDYAETVQDMYSTASVKGSIDSLPETIGTAVVSGNIFGVYIGNGNVIYAKSIADGVVKESVSDGKWTSWCEIPWIEYGSEKSFSNEIQFEEYDDKKKNNLGLVQWAIQAHENGWGYVYGTYGNVLTENLLQDRAAVFGGEVTDYMDFIRQNWLGKRTADCVGLIKGYGWYDAETGEIKVGSNGMMDVGANVMFSNATVKGTIDTIPEVHGLAVWVDGHIGITSETVK